MHLRARGYLTAQGYLRAPAVSPHPHANDAPVLALLAHLAVWAAVYVTAAVICAAQLTGTAHTLAPIALTFAWSTALLAYLLDRVKLRDAWLDPADQQAHPTRFDFLFARRRAARLFMASAGLVSLVSGWLLHPIAALATGASVAGVLLYAGRPRPAGAGPRIKDRFILKNLFVAVGIAGFALLVLGLSAAPDAPGVPAPEQPDLPARLRALLPAPPLLLALAALYLTLRVYADAVLCDIDDEAADRAFDTRTLPTRLGGERAWRVAMWTRLALAATLLLWPVGPFAARAAWAGASAAGTVLLRWCRPAKIRDLVDLRFGAEAALVWLTLRALGS